MLRISHLVVPVLTDMFLVGVEDAVEHILVVVVGDVAPITFLVQLVARHVVHTTTLVRFVALHVVHLIDIVITVGNIRSAIPFAVVVVVVPVISPVPLVALHVVRPIFIVIIVMSIPIAILHVLAADVALIIFPVLAAKLPVKQIVLLVLVGGVIINMYFVPIAINVITVVPIAVVEDANVLIMVALIAALAVNLLVTVTRLPGLATMPSGKLKKPIPIWEGLKTTWEAARLYSLAPITNWMVEKMITRKAKILMIKPKKIMKNR